jgi:L-fuculose-phosphate aldolase
MAVLGESLPPIIDETVPKLGSHIRVSEYAKPGTKQLGINVANALEDRSAALIANHGGVCIAKTLTKALHLAIVLERTCKIYMLAKQAGTPKLLPNDVVEEEQDLWEMMSGY